MSELKPEKKEKKKNPPTPSPPRRVSTRQPWGVDPHADVETNTNLASTRRGWRHSAADKTGKSNHINVNLTHVRPKGWGGWSSFFSVWRMVQSTESMKDTRNQAYGRGCGSRWWVVSNRSPNSFQQLNKRGIKTNENSKEKPEKKKKKTEQEGAWTFIDCQ